MLVAFDWALTVISDPEYQWLEIDSIKWVVDDIVIGKTDGTIICCQCKKNQSQHKAWSFSDIKDELEKAVEVLSNEHQAIIYFYSRSNFGELSSLKEFSSNFPDEITFHSNLGVAHKKTEAQLTELISKLGSKITSYTFLQRTNFETSCTLERMETILKERLRNLVSNNLSAYNLLWNRLSRLSMRDNNSYNSASNHRLQKGDLKLALNNAGVLVTPPMDLTEIRTSFISTSSIGRLWRRDIGNERITNTAVNEIIESINAKDHSILLTGAPGSGKTCVMLAVQEKLESLAKNSNELQPLFIQAREFADLNTDQDRQAMGLPELWVERAARIAENTHVVIMIDSLDVLSIAREHSVLTYFLAQIDRLLLIPNITVVTACREFDKNYDRRIAQRQWKKNILCQPLDWNNTIEPLLKKLGIDISKIDNTTRELIQNPRELALFVELALQEGSFNIVTSQALAQRYLETTIETNPLLKDTAMQAIESIASSMLKSRSLVVSNQQINASEDVKIALLSTGILHKTQEGSITFGHQTLLDVLVISGAIRSSITLNKFIQYLPPVPFVRPSIRSFVEQLAIGERKKFRSQLRTALTSNNAFHIRRLIAETFAEQIPQDDDWMLLRDLRNQHRDVFQVIYNNARKVEWHLFWMKHLIPLLKNNNDIEGLAAHIHRISQWKNEDPENVSKYWLDTLALLEKDNDYITNSISHYLTQINTNNLPYYISLFNQLLNLPTYDHSYLGHVLTLYIKADLVDDTVLWNYISNNICDEDLHSYNWYDKLRCQYHEFENNDNNFLIERMLTSTTLLNLAIESIERWSNKKHSKYNKTTKIHVCGFLRNTSYEDTHTKDDLKYLDNARILMNSIETAIKSHAISNSSWWLKNQERLCFNIEGSLRYFALQACILTPTTNVEIIGRMLSDKELLSSDLSYEIGVLINKAYILLKPSIQILIQENILNINLEYNDNSENNFWIIKQQAQLLITIPCYLRSIEAQEILHKCKKNIWPLMHEPEIYSWSGTVIPPFSFTIFINLSDQGILSLLQHYNGYNKCSSDNFLIGGERDVGNQLTEAASRQPSRFILFLINNWVKIPQRFRDNLLEGVVTYLSYCYGNLQSNNNWKCIETPNPDYLLQNTLNILERHPEHWYHNRVSSKAIKSCSHIIKSIHDAERLINLSNNFDNLSESSDISGNSVDLITIGINTSKGNIAESLIILANNFQKNNIPELTTLNESLRKYATDKHPSTRAIILQRLPNIIHYQPTLGWELFDLAIKENSEGLWSIAEPCLYYTYYNDFHLIKDKLEYLYHSPFKKDHETWARISALSAFIKHIDFNIFIKKIIALKTEEAWIGAINVWTHKNNIKQNREQCYFGIEASLSSENPYAIIIAHRLRNLFKGQDQPLTIPINLLEKYFYLLKNDIDSKQRDIFGFDAWLNSIAINDPFYALDVFEIYLDFLYHTKVYLSDYKNNLTQLLTCLFAQAEEQEESDNGVMLQRVVTIQDTLLTMGVNAVNDWLKAAERP
ncbi:AAA family ATPase [Photobacterium aquimaris]|nr:ATP-binding protein [Photobacterium aquimaris]